MFADERRRFRVNLRHGPRPFTVGQRRAGNDLAAVADSNRTSRPVFHEQPSQPGTNVICDRIEQHVVHDTMDL